MALIAYGPRHAPRALPAAQVAGGDARLGRDGAADRDHADHGDGGADAARRRRWLAGTPNSAFSNTAYRLTFDNRVTKASVRPRVVTIMQG